MITSQDAGLGARIGIADSFAVWTSLGGGLLLGMDGFRNDAGLGLEARYQADRYVVFKGRGGVERAETMLPVLDEGFDQQQLMVGVLRHFGGENP